MLDLLIRGGLLVDGTGAPGARGDLGVLGGRIACVGRCESLEAIQTIDAAGQVVAPGFLDSHTHAEGYLLDPQAGFSGKVIQGVTGEIMGNCGLSVFPRAQGREADLRAYFEPFAGPYHLDYDWSDYASLRDRQQGPHLPTNAWTLAGHGSLRIAAMGFARRSPSAAELAHMDGLLVEAFDQGAAGLSLGLMYPPGLYADGDELAHLAAIAARRGRPVTSHMRNETFGLLDSVREMLHLAELTGCTMVISHHKAVGRRNWGRLEQSLEMIDAARGRGLDVYCDVYPYTAGNTVLRSLLPPWALEGGIDRMLDRLRDPAERAAARTWIQERKDWENLSLAGGWDAIVISATRSRHEYEGHTVGELAAQAGVDPCEFVFDLLLEEGGQVLMLLFAASEDDLIAAMARPYCMIGSDGIPSSRPHPRLHGAFPRFLARYVLQGGIMTLEEGIHRITSLPAKIYGFTGRGILAPGQLADVVVFDPLRLSDNATYDDPTRPAEGVSHVLVGGVLVVSGGRITGERPGRLL